MLNWSVITVPYLFGHMCSGLSTDIVFNKEVQQEEEIFRIHKMYNVNFALVQELFLQLVSYVGGNLAFFLILLEVLILTFNLEEPTIACLNTGK